MVRKKIDNRIRVLIENGVKIGNRTMFVVLGEKGRDQVVLLHQMLSKSSVSARPNILWCYKKDLGFSCRRQKRMKAVERKLKSGSINVNEDDPFELFIATTNIRYCYYSETHRIIGNTYGMCILQDFESLTPNLLARAIETVQGGGIIVFLMLSVSSHRQLLTLSMDIHNRYRTEAHRDVIGRFNERFLLSLTKCKQCLVMDDKLNVIPALSSHILEVEPITEVKTSESETELRALKNSLRDTQPVGVLVNCCRTADQAKSLLTFIEAISEKTLRSTVSITAARGRGKSAVMGLAIAGAIAYGYNNIFVTSPSPENLTSLFEFIFKGLTVLEYQEHLDYDMVKSSNVEHNNAVVRINLFRDNRRQIIQYINPSDCHVYLGLAELVVIDEAAAIPLPLVRSLLGPYLVFLASTINGYEGTGLSLSMKLLKQLRQHTKTIDTKKNIQPSGKVNGRVLREIQLDESIRYRPGDEIERWLTSLLCLDATLAPPIKYSECPPAEKCNLYYINRDTLFSFNPESEMFLQRLVSLYVATDFKYSPNDLQMLSDAPGHHLFCLMSPVDTNSIPDVFVIIQVCLEGKIPSSKLRQGKRAGGDYIPWTIAQVFNDTNFPQLFGARIVRFATHPDETKGYGPRALELLLKYYRNEMKLDSYVQDTPETIEPIDEEDIPNLEESIVPRKKLPPLFVKVSQRLPETLDYLGVSYGLTDELLRFWKRAGFVPVYVHQTKNDLTGEHSCIMLSGFNSNSKWLKDFYGYFQRSFVSLLALEFSEFPTALALGLLTNNTVKIIKKDSTSFEQNDLFDLENYNENLKDIDHLLLKIATNYFLSYLGNTKLSAAESAILLGIALQNKSVGKLTEELGLSTTNLMGFVNRTIKQVKIYISSLSFSEEEEDSVYINNTESKNNGDGSLFKPIEKDLDDELKEAAEELKEKQMKELGKLKKFNLNQYIIKGSETEWNDALGKGIKGKNLISIKSGEKRLGDDLNIDLEVPKKKKMKKRQR